MSVRRILVIEDDAAIRRAVVDALTSAGYRADDAGDGETGLQAADSDNFDLVLLDLILPGIGGLEVLAGLRESQPATPVIILTAMGEEADRVRGLQLGADDYVVKPFSVRELLARVEAVLRRTPDRSSGPAELPIPDGTVDFARCEVRFSDGSRQELSERETKLLRYLASNAGRAISREELLSRVWGLNPKGVTTRTIDMHIARTREKLRDATDDTRTILTVRGKGYMLAAPSA
ncbi:MAG: response regulator transcription factor [Planctomycetaceae bacterium]|jgi:DNA-binding response OmpR family regulator|nr:response regulator transcription factor [Planctomycetaceae bacterium]MBT6157038.1 response regulator transcription factor [Planctomycetaceae bacterium]MBT6484396.1 response regulator transcription factor [Planctomycetaceae bacterium]MBT6498003.1 response regulator transcription factor [Planctomycetaceae bacterium]